MPAKPLPNGSRDVLAIPSGSIPDAITALVRRRRFSGLVSLIHRDMQSPDPALRAQAWLALKRLGFPE